MARAHFVKSARNNIYRYGKQVTKVHATGKNKGGEYTTRDKSQPEDKDDVIIVAKGESYYWWAFRFGGKHISKTPPSRSQLTQSDFLGQVYDLEDRLMDATIEDLWNDGEATGQSFMEDIVSEIETLRDETDEKLQNMPDHLQESSDSGMLLSERVEELQAWQDCLEAIDFDVDEELNDEEREEKLNEILSELQECTYNGN